MGYEVSVSEEISTSSQWMDEFREMFSCESNAGLKESWAGMVG